MRAKLFKPSCQPSQQFTPLWITHLCVSAALLSSLSACDSDDPSEVIMGGTEVTPTAGAGATEAGVMGATEAGVMSGTEAGVMGASEAGVTSGTEAGVMGATEAGQSLPVVESCEELNASACFANVDCAEGTRCQNVGPDDLPVACCVPGPRGTLAVGEPCSTETGELECASALCVTINDNEQGVCSGACADESECPASAPQCIPIAFSGSELNWCFPAE